MGYTMCRNNFWHRCISGSEGTEDEVPHPLRISPTTEPSPPGILGAANLGAVLYLGGMLSRLAGVPANALG